MGDDWEHEIRLERVLEAGPRVAYPRCTAAERACPPEDCGGAPGYESFLEALTDPEHPDHEDRRRGALWPMASVDISLMPLRNLNARAIYTSRPPGGILSPTVFRVGPYRFHFFSREESRRHVHVASGDGEAKFWLDPRIELARNRGLDARELRMIEEIIDERQKEIRDAWDRHLGA